MGDQVNRYKNPALADTRTWNLASGRFFRERDRVNLQERCCFIDIECFHWAALL
jgi:hypothetical protein